MSETYIHFHNNTDLPIMLDSWIEKGFEKYTNIGQFRSSPCASGNYSWLDYGIFECIFSDTESLECGLISFSYKTPGHGHKKNPDT